MQSINFEDITGFQTLSTGSSKPVMLMPQMVMINIAMYFVP